MINGYIQKHPDAVAQYVFDFESDIPDGDDLNDYTLTIFDSEGLDVTEDILRSALINTSDITVEFQGGYDGMNYRVTVIATLGLATTTPTRIIELRVRSQEV